MTAHERRLLRAFRALPEAKRDSLLDYAEFLLGRALPEAPETPSIPLGLPRPEQESVVKAIKRLRTNYPMVEPSKMLDATSDLMTQHLIHGRSAADIIDELEALFLQRFENQQ